MIPVTMTANNKFDIKQSQTKHSDKHTLTNIDFTSDFKDTINYLKNLFKYLFYYIIFCITTY